MEFIPLDRIEPGMVLAQDIYVFYSTHTALLRKGQTLSERFISRLRLLDIPGIYTHGPDDGSAAPENPLISRELKAKAVDRVKSVFDSVSDPLMEAQPDMEALGDVVMTLVDNILGDEQVLVNISDLKSYDDYTYHHSVSVCLLSIATGVACGMSRRQLHTLGLCAILHDIGKVRVPIELVTKPARLTNEEYGIIKRHSQLGGNYILEHRLGSERIYKSVVCHHERVDGLGYPLGLRGKDIPLESKIISVCDVFDALTSNRPYRSPLPYSEAVEHVMGNCGTMFDLDVVRSFLAKLEIYPVGSYVELSNGRMGVVVNNQNLLRPVVRLVDGNREMLDLYRDRSTRNVVITNSYRGLSATSP